MNFRNVYVFTLFSISMYSGFIQVRQNLMATNSSPNSNTIDLTDEDDSKPQRNAQNSPPALVALNIRGRQQIVQTQGAPRQLIATQQSIRNATIIAQARKLPLAGKYLEISFFTIEQTNCF